MRYICEHFGFLLFIAATLIVAGILIFDRVEGYQEPPPPIVFSELCTTTLTLAEAPNGLAGFTIRIDVPVISAITTSNIEFDDTNFPPFLQGIRPLQSMLVSGTDMNEVIGAGSSNVILFTVSPCIDKAVILILDDDNGNSIVPSGTEVFP